MSSLAPLMSSAKMDWNTPDSLLKLVRDLAGGSISLDPCTDASNPTGALRYFTPESDGLAQGWAGPGLVYANPPYGRALGAWAKKFHSESFRCNLLALVPARTDTQWWGDCVLRASAVVFWRGRIKFVGADGPAPFPSALIYWGDDTNGVRRVFGGKGWIP